MAIRYKKKCSRCKKNYVPATSRTRYAVCFECDSKNLKGEITDPMMKKFFDIPHELYVENQFLRSIKINYLRYGSLTDRQVEAFKEVVKKLKQKKEDEQ
jgi:DNA-directed RNA polymerase subunit RPC12/RpoP